MLTRLRVRVRVRGWQQARDEPVARALKMTGRTLQFPIKLPISEVDDMITIREAMSKKYE